MRALGTLFVLFCVCSRAYAQSASTVELELPGCLDASWRDQLVDTARLELRDDGATLVAHRASDPDTHDDRIAVDLPCSAHPNNALIQLISPEPKASAVRAVQLSDVPRHLRARTLALALAELWRSSNAPTSPARSAAAKTTQISIAAGTAPVSSPPSTATRADLQASHKLNWLQPSAAADAHPRQLAPVTSPPTASTTSPAGARSPDATPAGSPPWNAAASADEAESTESTPAAAAFNRKPTPKESASADTHALRAAATESSPLAATSIGPGDQAARFELRDSEAPSAGAQPDQRRPTAASARGGPAAVRAESSPLTAAADTKPQPLARADSTVRVDGAEPDKTAAKRSHSAAATLSIAPAMRIYLAARDALPGAQAAFSWRAWRIGAEGYYSTSADALGSARFGLVQGFSSWQLVDIELGAYGLALGPRAAIGCILATASAQSRAYSSSATVISWDASGEATFWRTLGDDWRLAVRVQLGYAQGTSLASDLGELARLHGLFATASLALELHLTDS